MWLLDQLQNDISSMRRKKVNLSIYLATVNRLSWTMIRMSRLNYAQGFVYSKMRAVFRLNLNIVKKHSLCQTYWLIYTRIIRIIMK